MRYSIYRKTTLYLPTQDGLISFQFQMVVLDNIHSGKLFRIVPQIVFG